MLFNFANVLLILVGGFVFVAINLILSRFLQTRLPSIEKEKNQSKIFLQFQVDFMKNVCSMGENYFGIFKISCLKNNLKKKIEIRNI